MLRLHGQSSCVVHIAPHIDERLIDAAASFDKRGRSIAEINRLVGAVAWALGLPRPSYEQVRQIVHATRAGRHPPRIALWWEATSMRRLPPDLLAELMAEPERFREIFRH
jgi:hypothetical protein